MAVKWQKYSNGNLWTETEDGLKFVIEQDQTPTPILRSYRRTAWNEHLETDACSYRTERGAKIAVGRMIGTRHVSSESATSKVIGALSAQSATARTSWETVGDSFTLGSLEEFKREAVAWLGDNTELKPTEIDKANYLEVLEHFRSYNAGFTSPSVDESAEYDATAVELIKLGYSSSYYNLSAIAEVIRGWLEMDVEPFSVSGMVEDIAGKHMVKKGANQ